MEKKLVICEDCRKRVSYSVEEVNLSSTLKGEKFEYSGKKAICDECGNEVYVSEVEEYNKNQVYDAYRERYGIISLDKIREIPVKYNIGKRPLSLLLGWGELTFTRYYDGYIPTKQYSDILIKIYDDPIEFSELMENNISRLDSPSTIEKSRKAIQKLLCEDFFKLTKIEQATQLILCLNGDITNLVLQKVLYYVQGFYFAFYGKFIFDDDCQAWVHGPVYRSIYDQFKGNRWNALSAQFEIPETAFEPEEFDIIRNVSDSFCIYGGKVLESFTHREKPWLITRLGLKPEESSQKSINKELIGEYFIRIKENYFIESPEKIGNYSRALFQSYCDKSI